MPFDISYKILNPYNGKYGFHDVLKIWWLIISQNHKILSLNEMDSWWPNFAIDLDIARYRDHQSGLSCAYIHSWNTYPMDANAGYCETIIWYFNGFEYVNKPIAWFYCGKLCIPYRFDLKIIACFEIIHPAELQNKITWQSLGYTHLDSVVYQPSDRWIFQDDAPLSDDLKLHI